MSSALEFFIAIRDTLNQHMVFTLGILLVTGYFMGKIAERFNLPSVTGYLLAGLLLGDSILGIIHVRMGETLRSITDIALGIIAITIGSEFSLAKLQRLGKKILIITIFQLFFTFIIVAVCLNFFGLPIFQSLLLGAIASATAPAATVVIIRSLKAKGDFVDTLYGVVALDDAGCVLLFSCVFAFSASAMGVGSGMENTLVHGILHAVKEIMFSLLLGIFQGAITYNLTSRLNKGEDRLILAAGILFLFTAGASALHLSLLLTNMAAGTVIANLSKGMSKSIKILQPLTPPLYALFFSIAGTELNLAVLLNWHVILLGSVYVISRGVGKYFGVWAGAAVSGSAENIKKYLGFAMMPQAGVAIGLILMVQASPLSINADKDLQEILNIITNIVLFGVAINELIGPYFSKMAILKAIKDDKAWSYSLKADI
jgi:Kef-type K+ transport system membrane component KefB